MDKEILIDQLIEKGWFMTRNFLSSELCHELILDRPQEMKKAGIGKGQNLINESIRKDSIAWLDNDNSTSSQKKFLLAMNELQELVNRTLYLGIKSFECHYAHYQAGGFYKKHLDQHQNTNKRVLSSITYLNSPQNGGELVIYKRDEPNVIETKIKPEAGTMVCFLSDKIYHEVLETMDDRYSLTGWFRTDVE